MGTRTLIITFCVLTKHARFIPVRFFECAVRMFEVLHLSIQLIDGQTI